MVGGVVTHPTATATATSPSTPTATATPTNTPVHTATPTDTPTPTATYTPTSPPPTVFANAVFTYDGDGKRVKSVINSTETTYFIGTHYEVTGGVVTKYYYAGSQRIAMRTNGTLNYLLGDHLGSTSLSTDAAGNVVSELRYKAWGEVRYSSGSTPTAYQYTGQYSYASDFGLLFYNARWYDPYLNHFTQPDTIVPDPYNPQAWDRYAYARNNPLKYTDPTGHDVDCVIGDEACRKLVVAEKTADKLFDPYRGALPDIEGNSDYDFGTYGGTLESFNQEMKDAYEAHDVDLEHVADITSSNPVDDEEFLSWEESEELGVENLRTLVFMGNSDHIPYTLFLNKLGIPSDRETHWMNYESNYLDAQMTAHPEALRAAKKEYIFGFLLRDDRQLLNTLVDQGVPMESVFP